MNSTAWTLFAFLLLTAACRHEPAVPDHFANSYDIVPFVPASFKRLPDLNVPRSDHVILSLNGELTVIGGHTTGFVPTATAEYLRNGRWHKFAMLYPHDNPFAVVLNSGCVMVGGGSGESFGIGQSWGVESYDPSTHSFSSLPILNRKRALASAVALDSGKVLVSGNWYGDDGLEVYIPGSGFKAVGPVSEARVHPVMLRSSADNVIIFGRSDCYGKPLPGVVDRLYGPPFCAPILQEWAPAIRSSISVATQCAIDTFSYLIPAVRKRDGQSGILLVCGEVLSLLETEAAIPMRNPAGDEIRWGKTLLVDRAAGCAFLPGEDERHGVYILKAEYAAACQGGKAPLKVYYAMFQDDVFPCMLFPALLSDGRIVFAGGPRYDNYTPTAAVFAFDLSGTQRVQPIKFMLPASLAGILLLSGLFFIRRRRTVQPAAVVPEQGDAETDARQQELMDRVVALLEERQIYKVKGLQVSDLAQELGTNVTYVSSCINRLTGRTFNDFVNGYRVRFAQELLRADPGLPLTEVIERSGFSSYASFLRHFKGRTGKTPSEWLSGLSE